MAASKKLKRQVFLFMVIDVVIIFVITWAYFGWYRQDRDALKEALLFTLWVQLAFFIYHFLLNYLYFFK